MPNDPHGIVCVGSKCRYRTASRIVATIVSTIPATTKTSARLNATFPTTNGFATARPCIAADARFPSSPPAKTPAPVASNLDGGRASSSAKKNSPTETSTHACDR